MTTVIEARGIVQRYGPRTVLDGLDLTIEAGSIVGLFGPSGSGKTTLLNIIGALSRPTAGKVSVLGKDILRMGERARTRLRRKKLGFIFQSAPLLPTYTARENIDLALRLPKLGYFERRRRANNALDAVGLREWADHMPDELSGGQRQRIAIARVLALQPTLILADEPTSGLDTQTTHHMLAYFQHLAHHEGTSFVIVSHDVLVLEYVDLAYDLLGGKVVARDLQRATPDEATLLLPTTELLAEPLAEGN